MRRVLLMLLACLVLGAITTVAIAWTSAYLVDRHAAIAAPHQQSKVYFGEGEWHSARLCESTGGEILLLLFMGPLNDPHSAPADFPEWTLVRREPRMVYESLDSGDAFQEEAWGWPFRAMHSAVWFQSDYLPWSIDSIQRGRAASMKPQAFERRSAWILDQTVFVTAAGIVQGPHVIHSLPLRPLAFGFLADTVLFGSAWWLLLDGWRRLRGTLRRRRGCCPMCGYDLRGDLARGCSECGWNRGPAAVER